MPEIAFGNPHQIWLSWPNFTSLFPLFRQGPCSKEKSKLKLQHFTSDKSLNISSPYCFVHLHETWANLVRNIFKCTNNKCRFTVASRHVATKKFYLVINFWHLNHHPLVNFAFCSCHHLTKIAFFSRCTNRNNTFFPRSSKENCVFSTIVWRNSGFNMILLRNFPSFCVALTLWQNLWVFFSFRL